MNRPTIVISLNIIPEMRFKIHLTMIMSLNWGEYELDGLHFNNVGLLVKLHNRVVHIITKETIHHALEQIPLFRLYINMYNQQSPLIQTTPGFVVVELPDHLFSSEEYFLLYHHNGGYLPLPYGRKYYVQLDRLMHAVEYLGFSRIKMNYDLLDLLSSDCLRIKRKNRYEGLYIAYYMTNFRLFAKQVLTSFGCRRFIFPEEQPTFQIFVKLVHSEVKRSRLGFCRCS